MIPFSYFIPFYARFRCYAHVIYSRERFNRPNDIVEDYVVAGKL
jgi:hypothetical protein